MAEDLTKANLRKGSPNLLQMALSCVGKQITSESMDSCSAGGLGGTKNHQPSSSRLRASTAHSSGPGPSDGAVDGCGQDPNEPRQAVSLAMYISDCDEFADDPHQIIPIEDAFALPYLPRQNLEGFNQGYLLPARVTIMSQVMSGQVILVHLLGITLIKGMWL